VRDLNRLELAGESVHALVEALSAAAPDWLAQVIDVAGWSRRYGRRVDSWKLPTSKTKQDALALDYARDGFALLGALYAPGQPMWLRELPAVQALRTVLLQNYTRITGRGGREVIKRREKTDEGGTATEPGSSGCPSSRDCSRAAARRPMCTRAWARRSARQGLQRDGAQGRYVQPLRPHPHGGQGRAR
jgi:hypothetical protein